MNKVILMGRLTKNPEIKYAGKDNDMAVARYTLAVNRRYKRDGEGKSVCDAVEGIVLKEFMKELDFRQAQNLLAGSFSILSFYRFLLLQHIQMPHRPIINGMP